MTYLEDFPLPATSKHDEHGNHIRPHIPEWRAAATQGTPAYDPGRVISGQEVQRDDRQKRAYAAHLAEHRRLGQPAEES